MVAASGANATVACPQCGQAIIVPSLARVAQPEPPKPWKWWWVVAGVVVVAFLAAGVLIWQKHQPLAAQTKPAPAKMSAKNVSGKGANGMTPLHTAAANGWKDEVERLVAAGADVRARAKDGATPLHWAVFNNHNQRQGQPRGNSIAIGDNQQSSGCCGLAAPARRRAVRFGTKPKY